MVVMELLGLLLPNNLFGGCRLVVEEDSSPGSPSSRRGFKFRWWGGVGIQTSVLYMWARHG